MIAICAMAVATSLPAQQSEAQETEPAIDRMEWFREAKFGMFIHWESTRSWRVTTTVSVAGNTPNI